MNEQKAMLSAVASPLRSKAQRTNDRTDGLSWVSCQLQTVVTTTIRMWLQFDGSSTVIWRRIV